MGSGMGGWAAAAGVAQLVRPTGRRYACGPDRARDGGTPVGGARPVAGPVGGDRDSPSRLTCRVHPLQAVATAGTRRGVLGRFGAAARSMWASCSGSRLAAAAEPQLRQAGRAAGCRAGGEGMRADGRVWEVGADGRAGRSGAGASASANAGVHAGVNAGHTMRDACGPHNAQTCEQTGRWERTGQLKWTTAPRTTRTRSRHGHGYKE